jgi:hypothetical protein
MFTAFPPTAAPRSSIFAIAGFAAPLGLAFAAVSFWAAEAEPQTATRTADKIHTWNHRDIMGQILFSGGNAGELRTFAADGLEL